MKINALGFSCKNIISLLDLPQGRYGCSFNIGLVVHLLLLKFSMIHLLVSCDLIDDGYLTVKSIKRQTMSTVQYAIFSTTIWWTEVYFFPLKKLLSKILFNLRCASRQKSAKMMMRQASESRKLKRKFDF